MHSILSPICSLREQTGAFVQGGLPPRNLAMQRGLGGKPHERLHQDKVLTPNPISHHNRNKFSWISRRLKRTPVSKLSVAQAIKDIHRMGYLLARPF